MRCPYCAGAVLFPKAGVTPFCRSSHRLYFESDLAAREAMVARLGADCPALVVAEAADMRARLEAAKGNL